MIILLKSGVSRGPAQRGLKQRWRTRTMAHTRQGWAQSRLAELKFWLEREATGCLMTGSLTKASQAETVKMVKPQTQICLRKDLRVLKPWLPVGTTATFGKEGRLSLWPNTVGSHLVEFNTKASMQEWGRICYQCRAGRGKALFPKQGPPQTKKAWGSSLDIFTHVRVGPFLNMLSIVFWAWSV